jgi:hypothetical protein
MRGGTGDCPFAKMVKFGVHSVKFVSCIIVAPRVARLLDSSGSLLQKLRSGSEAGLLGRPAGTRPRCSWAVSAAGPLEQFLI